MDINILKKSSINALISSICLVFAEFIVYFISKETPSKILFLLLCILSFICFFILNILMSIIQKNYINKEYSANKSIITWTVVIIFIVAIGMFLYINK